MDLLIVAYGVVVFLLAWLAAAWRAGPKGAWVWPLGFLLLPPLLFAALQLGTR